jgi:hypothetical protein
MTKYSTGDSTKNSTEDATDDTTNTNNTTYVRAEYVEMSDEISVKLSGEISDERSA